MNKQELKNKVWYRALVALFVVSFLTSLVIVSFIAFVVSSEKVEISHVVNNSNHLTLTLDQQKQILQNAPPGTTPDGIVKGLVDRGYTLQGLNDGSNPAYDQYNAQTNPPKVTFTYVDRYSAFQKALFYSGAVLMVCLVFWLISRIFFFVVIGAPFLQIPLKKKGGE